MGILLTHARIVLRVMEDGGVMENANGAMINAKCIIMTMMIVIIVVNMIMIVGNHVCASKAELTKYIFDCQQQGSQEVSYSLEKMESCLQQKIYGHNSKDSTDEMVCAKRKDVLNRIQECKNSSNTIYSFKDCLLSRIWPSTRK